eukprot:TRINITY_DN16463_c0_g2_i1.p1 TRINITY_DN16463_c0_g2~~TRINITY_DN16463_c0_g2_i1.p1  ORF type:complete len:109 (+),score=2.91 TRINITY_DN16463_c0_g2_i1:79-405(+)
MVRWTDQLWRIAKGISVTDGPAGVVAQFNSLTVTVRSVRYQLSQGLPSKRARYQNPRLAGKLERRRETCAKFAQEKERLTKMICKQGCSQWVPKYGTCAEIADAMKKS